MLEAAQRAGVQRFIPSSWGFDFDKLPCALSDSPRIVTLLLVILGSLCCVNTLMSSCDHGCLVDAF